MPSKLKGYMLDELRSQFEDVEHCVVMNFSGVSASEMAELRTVVRRENGTLRVVKNSVISRALRELGRDEEFIEFFDGPVAVAYGEDAAGVVRALSDWNKKAKKLEFKGGIVGGRAIRQEAVTRLATLPPLPVMQAMALGAIAAPLTSLLTLGRELIQGFVRIVDQLARKQGGDGGSSAEVPVES
jgi:large subunit ribosomal protein L10